MNLAAIDHPANANLRRLFEPGYVPERMQALAKPEDVAQPYMSLGTHPDLVARLWDELPAKLPVDCRVIFFGRPALMHPASGVVFGFARGTHTYALRLPEPQYGAAIRAGAERIMHYPVGQPSMNLATIGAGWLFGKGFADEQLWCLAAFEFAGRG
ncbi:MAG: hypothetical protein ABL931_07595 [Usitatibacteraceae bacterium]